MKKTKECFISNIKWNNIKEKPLPRDGSTYLIIWKGQIALAALDFEEDKFWISFLPNQYETMLLSNERENEISHWTTITYPKEILEIKKKF